MLARSWRVGRLAGIDLRLDPSWFLIAALLTWSLAAGYFPALLPDARGAALLIVALAAMLGLFGSLILHELAHALVARTYGMQVRSITLFLFGGVAELGAEPPSARAEAAVALAGPLASLAIAAAAYLLAGAAGAIGAGPAAVAILTYLALANLILAVFNMLPAFPLDGGRVLRAILWGRSADLRGATQMASGVSRWIAFGMIALGVVQILGGAGAFAIWPILIALFILAAAQSARVRSDVEEALAHLRVSDVMRANPVVADPSANLQDVVDKVLLRHGLSYVPVVEAGRLLGEIDLATIREIDRDLWSGTRVNDVFHTFGPGDIVGPQAAAAPLFERMLREDRRKFPVAAGGRLLGIVTLADLLTRAKMFDELSATRP